MVKKAVIICGGMATRFLPLSKSIPKEMLPVLDKPILQILVEQLRKAGIEDILVIVGRNKECIERHFTNNIELEQHLIKHNKAELIEVANSPNMFIHYLVQDAPNGTGHCINLAKTFTGNDPFAVLFGDELMLSDNQNIIEQLVETFNKYEKTVISTQTCPMEEVYKYGIIDGVKLDDNVMKVNNIVEKPKVEDAPSNVCYLGTGILTAEIYDKIALLPRTEKELQIVDAYNLLAKEDKVITRNIDGKRLDMGNPFGFVVANIESALHSEYAEDMKRYIKELNDRLN